MLRMEFTKEKNNEFNFVTFTHRIKNDWYQFSKNCGYLELIDMHTDSLNVDNKKIDELKDYIVKNKIL